MKAVQLAKMLCFEDPVESPNLQRMLQDYPTLADELSFQLMETKFYQLNRHKLSGILPDPLLKQQVRDQLKYMDWILFRKMREGLLTLDQIRAKIDAKNFDLYYKVLDDYNPGKHKDDHRAAPLNSKVYANCFSEQHQVILGKMYGKHKSHQVKNCRKV